MIPPGISISDIDDGKSSSSKPRGRPKRTQVADLDGREGDDDLTEELVVFGLFDIELPADERRKMADK